MAGDVTRPRTDAAIRRALDGGAVSDWTPADDPCCSVWYRGGRYVVGSPDDVDGGRAGTVEPVTPDT